MNNDSRSEFKYFLRIHALRVLLPITSLGDALRSDIHRGLAKEIMTVHQNKSKTGHNEITSLKN